MSRARHVGRGGAVVQDLTPLAQFGELGDADAAASCLRDLAVVLKQQGRLEEAARLWASGNALSQFENVTVFEREIGDLPEIDWNARELTLEEALALVQEDPG